MRDEPAPPPPAFTTEQLRLLADSLPQLVWTANDAGEVDYYNSKVVEYGGWSEHDGTYAWQPLIHPDELEPTMQAWSAAAAAGCDYEFEHRLLMADGEYQWHLSRARPLRDTAGTVVKWFGTATNIHVQRLAQERLETTARVLQHALLPDRLPDIAHVQLAARYQPAAADQEVGGDWFDVIDADGRLYLVIGDVAGHGVESAAAMGAARHAVATTARSGGSPAQCLTKANSYLASLGHDFVTCCVVQADVASSTVCTAVAGHPVPFMSSSGKVAPLCEMRPGLPLGVQPDTQYDEDETALAEMIVLFTDGLVERRDRGMDDCLVQLADLVASVTDQPVGRIGDELMSRLAADARDDVALLVARFDLGSA